MALRWNWDEKIGDLLWVEDYGGQEKEYQVNLYNSNAFLTMIYEFEENGTEKYQLFGFFNDEAHMKNCFGLNKKDGYWENIYCKAHERIKKVRINKKKFKDTKKFVNALVQAFDEIDIEIYSEEAA